jgi:hypothetical protein
MKIYNKNKPLFDAYLNSHSVEGFSYENSDTVVCTKVENIPIWVVILFIIIHLILFVWAISIIMVKWKIIPEWAKSVSIICLVLNLPVFSLLFVYASTMKIEEQKPASI